MRYQSETIAAAKFFGKTVKEWLTPSAETIGWDGQRACGFAWKGFRNIHCNQTVGEIPWR